MLINDFEHGKAPLATVTFVDINDAAADPTAVTFKLKAPDDTVTTVTAPDAAIANPTVGTWTYQLSTLTQEGVWTIRAEGVGGVDTAVEATFNVPSSEFY